MRLTSGEIHDERVSRWTATGGLTAMLVACDAAGGTADPCEPVPPLQLVSSAAAAKAPRVSLKSFDVAFVGALLYLRLLTLMAPPNGVA